MINFEDTIRQLKAVQDEPEKLTLKTVDIVLTTHEPALHNALEAAAVHHWFDARILSSLLDTDETTATRRLGKLENLPMVESFTARRGWNVHEASRLALRNRLARKEPARLRALSARAAECLEGDDPAWRVEVVYHRPIATLKEAADQLERLWKEWDNTGRYEQLQRFGVALNELIRTDHMAPMTRVRSQVCLVWIRCSTLSIRKAEALSREALTLFQELRHESGQMDAHDQLGDALQDAGNLAGALQEYDAYQQTARRLTQRDPDNTDWQRGLSVSHSTVGGVYEAQGLYAEAEPLHKRFLAIVKKALGPEHP